MRRAELLAAAPLHAIVYGFTSSSYVRGAADDAALKSRLEARTRGIPVTIPCAAAVAALTVLGAKRLALISPQWFSFEMDQNGARYFSSQGFEVVHSGPAGLPSDQQAIQPRELYEWVRTPTPTSADAIFIGGNGFRAIGVIKALEEELNRKPSRVLACAAFSRLARISYRLRPNIRGDLDRTAE
jgi:maleate isomerase